MLEWGEPATMPVKKDCEDYRAGDLLLFVNAGNVQGNGERVLVEYDGQRILGNLYREGMLERFVPMNPEEPVIELRGVERDRLRVIGVPCVLIRQLL